MDRAVDTNLDKCQIATADEFELANLGMLTRREVGDRYCCVLSIDLHMETDGVCPAVPVKSWFTSVQRQGLVVPFLCEMGPDTFRQYY